MAFTPTEEAQLRAVITAFESGKTISEIAASTEVFTTDVLEIVQSAVSKKATIAQIVTLVNSELGITAISSKLSGIEAGAQVNAIESIKVNSTVLPVSSKSVNITVPTQPSDIGAQPEGDYATNTQLATKEPANANIQTHIGSTSNPHSVTKTQVGLGNVDNTSDVNKPISSAQQTALNLKVDKVTGSSLVADTEITANQIAVKKVTTLTTDGGQLTGFVDPIGVGVSYNGITRKITLTGDIRAAYKGIHMTEIIPSFVSGWQSEAHDITNGGYFLYFNGTNFVWSTIPWDFKQLQIASVYRGGVNFCLRECHGLMDWQSHESNHNNIGTYLKSGADVSGFILNSDVATNRRPTVSQALVYDEDLPSILPELTNGLYSRLFLDGANNANLENDKTDIIEYTAGNRFTYNLFTGGVWTKAKAANNQYAKVFLMAVPVTSDADCQKNRFIWIMPQTVNSTLTTIQNLTPANLSLGQISTALAEYVFVQEFIIRATASGWTIISTAKLAGNKRFQSVTSGNFLSSVAHDTSITGDGTSGNPLGTTHAILPNKNEEADFQHLTAAQVTKVNNTSGTNTGDETLTSIKTKLGAATPVSDGYLKYQDWSIFNSKEPAFSKNSAFNKNFGTTAGTVLEGRTFGTAANSAVGDFQPTITGLTTNNLVKWNGSSFVNSLISDDGSKVQVYRNINADILLTDGTLGTSYGGMLRGYGTTGSGGGVKLGTYDGGVFYPWVTVNAKALTSSISGIVNFTSTTTSTSPTTGALVVNGGIGADHVRANNFYGNGSNLTGVQLPITLTTNGTSGAATFSGNVLNVPNYAASGGVNQTQTTVNGSTSGYIVCSMPFQTASYKKVVVYLNALTGNVTYTFPVQFLRAPQINTGNAGIAPVTYTATATSLTLVGGTNTIGWITLEGY